MSYAFKLVCKDGKIRVEMGEGMAVHIPDGEFTLNGHHDARSTSMYVTFRSEDGQRGVTLNTGTIVPPQPEST